MKKIPRSSMLLVGIFLAVAAVTAIATAYVVSNNNQPLASTDKAYQVSLLSDHADPDTITIKAGETVQFNSKDGKTHSLSLGEGGHEHQHTGPFNSGEFGADESWRATFNEPGTFFLHDHDNPDINILVVSYK